MRNELHDSIKIQYKLSDDVKLEYKIVEPIELLCPNRLDISAKVLYLNLRTKNKARAEHLYIEHMRAMTKGSFYEAYSSKTTPQAFIDVFDKLFEDMRINGYDESQYPVPVDKNMQILDGAHRVAASIVLKKRIPIVIVSTDACDCYDQSFFLDQGVDENIIDDKKDL